MDASISRGQAVADIAIISSCFIIALAATRFMTTLTMHVLKYVARWALAFALLHGIAALMRENATYLAARNVVASGIDSLFPGTDPIESWVWIEVNE